MARPSAAPDDDARTPPSLAEIYLAESGRENRSGLRIAMAVAIVLHLGLFAVQLPEAASTEVPPVEKKLFAIQQVRFEPPPPAPQKELPKPRATKVPIPDPTPDAPEPIRLPEEIEPMLEPDDLDLLVVVPDGPPPKAEPSGPIPVGGDVLRPVPTYAPEPAYTEAARRAGIQGRVILRAIIDREGRVESVEILRGLPMGLDRSAADALGTWRFEPATLHGEPVAVSYVLSIDFGLR